MKTPIENCPQGDEPIRERAWTAEQLERLARLARNSHVPFAGDMAEVMDAFAAVLRQQGEQAVTGSRCEDCSEPTGQTAVCSICAGLRCESVLKATQAVDIRDLQAALAQNAQLPWPPGWFDGRDPQNAQRGAVAWQHRHRGYPDEWKECTREEFEYAQKHPDCPREARELYLHAERARVPDGMVLVPREPTPEMLAAVEGATCSVRVAEDDSAEYPLSEDECAEIYRNMLAADPPQRAEVDRG